MNKEKQQIQQTKLQNNKIIIDQQKNVRRALKCTLQSLSVLHERPDTKVTHKHIVWNDSHFTCLFHAPSLFLILTAALQVLVYMRFCIIMEYSVSVVQKRCLEHTGPVLSKSLHTMAKVTEQRHGWVIIHESKTAEISCLCTALHGYGCVGLSTD